MRLLFVRNAARSAVIPSPVILLCWKALACTSHFQLPSTLTLASKAVRLCWPCKAAASARAPLSPMAFHCDWRQPKSLVKSSLLGDLTCTISVSILWLPFNSCAMARAPVSEMAFPYRRSQ